MTNISLNDLRIDTKDFNIIIPVILTIISFSLYWFICESKKIKDYFYKRNEADIASSRYIFFTKYIGLISMGIIPAIACLLLLPEYNLAFYGLALIPETNLFSILWIVGLGALLMLLAFLTAGNAENLKNYPQVRASVWTNKMVIHYAIGWALYLLGYEFLFRGVLLRPMVIAIGVWPAIAINIAIYSAVHIPKGLKETIGAIPLGFVLCLLTLSSGTIWIAFFTHLIMALTNSFRALYLHPDFHYFKNKP